MLQTQTTNSLIWAEKQLTLDCITDFVPSVAERVSFAALQPVSGKTFIAFIISLLLLFTSYQDTGLTLSDTASPYQNLKLIGQELLVIGNNLVFRRCK